MDRQFTVIVPKQPRNKRNMKYPPLDAKKAINTMAVLHGRGFFVFAETRGCGGIEHLTLEEMKEIYTKA